MKTERKRGKIFIVITVVVVFAVLVGFFSNTVAFERMMGKIVERYVSDNNYELASQHSPPSEDGTGVYQGFLYIR